MLKKKLIKENTLLFERLNKANAKISNQASEIEKLRQEIDSLKKEMEALNKEEGKEIAETLEIRNDTSDEKEELEEVTDIEYGASVIGKIVLLATKHSNLLSVDATPEAKELINLILGRAEVAKSEILNIVLSQSVLEEKIKQIDKIHSTASDYFESVMQQ